MLTIDMQRPEWAATDDKPPNPTGKNHHVKRMLKSKTEPIEVKLETGIEHQAHAPFAVWTGLIYDIDNPSTLLLTSQDSRVRKVVQTSMIFFWAFFCWTNTYPGSASLIEYMCKSLLKAAKHLDCEEMVNWISADTRYVEDLSTIVRQSHPFLLTSINRFFAAQWSSQCLACQAQGTCRIRDCYRLGPLQR